MCEKRLKTVVVTNRVHPPAGADVDVVHLVGHHGHFSHQFYRIVAL